MPGYPQRILLTPTALIGERWNGDTRALEREEVDDPMPWLRVAVALEGKVTLGALFAVVGGYPELMDFLARYAGCAGLRAFHEEAAQAPPSAPEDARPLEAVECYRLVQITDEGVETWVDFHGLGATDERGEAVPYEIGWSPPMNEIAPLPLCLRPTSEIIDERESTAGGAPVRLGVVPARYTLLEILAAIYFELSFQGATPAQRNAAAAHLADMAREGE